MRDEGDVKVFRDRWKKGPSAWGVGGVHADGVGILFGTRDFILESVISVVPGGVLCMDCRRMCVCP